MKPDSGRIYVLGQDVTQMSENELFDLRRQIGMVFQESALFDSRTVRENVAFRLMEEGTVSDDEIERRVREALSFVELERTVDMFPSELSGGMRRRVAIARAIVTQPEILLYDSPTGGLDPVTSTTIVELIVKQRDVYKTSSLMVTHRLQDAFIMATHYFDRTANKMLALPKGVHCEVPMAFLILRDGKVILMAIWMNWHAPGTSTSASTSHKNAAGCWLSPPAPACVGASLRSCGSVRTIQHERDARAHIATRNRNEVNVEQASWLWRLLTWTCAGRPY